MPSRAHRISEAYHRRILASLAVVLVGAIALVHLWPAPVESSSDLPFSSRPSDAITIQEITPTSQSQELKPPPPAPLPPVVVPNDVLIEEPLTFDEGLDLKEPGEDERRQEGTADEAVASRMPDVNARLLRAVQPRYPEKAQKDDVRARIVVEVQVNERGRVTDATILEHQRLSGHAGTYGLEASALAAARRTLFRPAQSGGAPVPTRTTLTFTFGE